MGLVLVAVVIVVDAAAAFAPLCYPLHQTIKPFFTYSLKTYNPVGRYNTLGLGTWDPDASTTTKHQILFYIVYIYCLLHV